MARRPSVWLSVAVLGVWSLFGPGVAAAGDRAAHEVWVIDQSDTTADGGGTLYIFRGSALAGRAAPARPPRVVDLGGAARELCLSTTGSAPRRPHMLDFNATHSHGVLAFVATGHVLFLDAAARPVGCVDVGVQAHAAVVALDDSYAVVANQNGKLLQRIRTDFGTNTFTLDGAATLDLASGTTPSGAARQDQLLRPDNAPICPIVDSTGRSTFVTLRGGGMFIVDTAATPMRIVSEYDAATIHPNGCGGVEKAGRMYVNSGGGTPANPLESDLYVCTIPGASETPNPPNVPAPKLVFSQDDEGFVDAHGATKAGRHYIWVGDRAANRVTVVDAKTDREVGRIGLGSATLDPAPDLMDIAPAGNRVYVSFRGPNPLTGNVPAVGNAVGNSPGLGILRVKRGGRTGTLQAVVPISHVVDGVERADPHAIAVRRTHG
jgi:hypothetical protein